MYVYKITNLIDQKVYIGSTNDPERRWKEHKYQAFAQVKSNLVYEYPLYRAIRKYGLENFSFEILLCNVSKEEIGQKEKEKIIEYKSLCSQNGYNQTLQTQSALKDSKKNINKKPTCALVDNNNNILETFSSYYDASLKVFGDKKRFSNIRRVCKGSATAIYSKIFRDLDEEGKIIIPEQKTRPRYKKIYGININNPEDIVYYNSVSEAARQENISRESISKCLQGSTKYSHVGGRKWYELKEGDE